MRFTRRVLGPCRACLELMPGSVQASHLLLLLFSFGSPCLMLLNSQHIISHVAAGLLFSGPPKEGLAFFGSDQEPRLGIIVIPADHVEGTGFCPRGPRPRLSRRENPDFCVSRTRISGPLRQGKPRCFPSGSEKGLAEARGPCIVEDGLSHSLWNLTPRTQLIFGL